MRKRQKAEQLLHLLEPLERVVRLQGNASPGDWDSAEASLAILRERASRFVRLVEPTHRTTVPYASGSRTSKRTAKQIERWHKTQGYRVTYELALVDDGLTDIEILYKLRERYPNDVDKKGQRLYWRPDALGSVTSTRNTLVKERGYVADSGTERPSLNTGNNVAVWVITTLGLENL